MRGLASSLVFGLLVTIFAQAAAPATVRLRATPQKYREFYAIDDARIPISIRNQLAEPARTAHRGRVRWTIETDALVRNLVPRVARRRTPRDSDYNRRGRVGRRRPRVGPVCERLPSLG